MKVREGQALRAAVARYRARADDLDGQRLLRTVIEARAYRALADDLERVLNELYLNPTP